MNITWSFNSCGATGTIGPSLSQLNISYYSNQFQSYEANIGINQVTLCGNGIQKWKIPYSGQYIIECAGAQGGRNYNSIQGGRGAFLSGIFDLNKNDVLYILVGQKGITNSVAGWGAGGGGASYVCIVCPSPYLFTVTGEYVVPLIISGGGGGGGTGGVSYNGPGLALASTFPTLGEPYSSSGAGFEMNGVTNDFSVSQSFLNGGMGDIYPTTTYAGGGFGGGGRPYNAGGGGGGYHGGSAGTGSSSGFGGDSFINGTILSRIDGHNTGDGYIRITFISNDLSHTYVIPTFQCHENYADLLLLLLIQFNIVLSLH